MTDKLNGEDPKNIVDDYQDYSLTSELYETGREKLYKQGYLIIPDSSGRYAFHRVYNLEGVYFDEDINYPDDFKVWREISNNTNRGLLQNVIAGWGDEALVTFWWPFIQPNKNKNSALYTYTEVLLYEKGIQEKKESGDPFKEYMSPSPVVGSTPKEQKEFAPRTWIPLKEWFPESVKEIQIEDILTIFPPAESELLALVLGRAVVGRSNHLPPGWKEPIKHTSRMAALTLGEDPGLGKTSLFKAFFQALETVGYIVETFDNFGAQFNMGGPITSDILYKDDLTDTDLKKLVKSGVAKSIISGSDQIKVQDKGVDAHNVFPRTTIIANTNNFNPRLLWELDPGFADRLKLLSTYREAEIPMQETSDLSRGSSDLRPFTHIPYLSEKLGVSQRCIMLWFARLCADRFLESIQDRTTLEDTVDRLTLKLREPLHKDSASQLFTMLLFFGSLSDRGIHLGLQKPRKEIQLVDWEASLKKSYAFLRKKKTYQNLFNWLKEDYNKDEKPDPLHPYIGVTVLDAFSLKSWVLSKSDNHGEDRENDYLVWLKECMKTLRMRNGLPYSHDEVWLIKAYKKIYYYLPSLYGKVDKCMLDLDPEDYIITMSED